MLNYRLLGARTNIVTRLVDDDHDYGIICRKDSKLSKHVEAFLERVPPLLLGYPTVSCETEILKPKF